MSPRQRKRYDSEFKREAVRLVLSGRTVSDVADGLGIHPNVLSRWKREYLENQDSAFPGKGYLKPEEQKIKDLERKLRDVTEERDILKKAVAIFSKHPK
jgi:transposase